MWEGAETGPPAPATAGLRGETRARGGDGGDGSKKRPGRAAPVREDRKGVADYFGDFPFFTGLKPVIFSTSSVA